MTNDSIRFALLVATLSTAAIACGGKIAEGDPAASTTEPATPAASASPAAPASATPPIVAPSPDAAVTADASPTATPTAAPTADGVTSALRPAVGDCGARPWASSSYPSGTLATEIVDQWLHGIFDGCQPAGAPVCGTLTVHFTRMPEPACVDELRFSEPPSSALLACALPQLDAVRLAAGNFVDGDTWTTKLCP